MDIKAHEASDRIHVTTATVSSTRPTGTLGSAQRDWEPRIVAFFCNWCTYTAADLAGVSRMKYAPNVRVIRLMCSGRVDPQFVLAAFANGADGVLLGGCHIGDCHYAEGNFKTLRRLELLRRMLRDLGIEERRVRLEWISAAEGERVKAVVDEMVKDLRQLGPLGIPQRRAEWNLELLPVPVAASLGEAGLGSAATSAVTSVAEPGPASPDAISNGTA